MESGHPGARPEPKPESHPKTLPILATRKYPKPPPLLKRLLFFCLKPEAWAASAQYPFHVTLLPLLLAIFLAAVSMGITWSFRASNVLVSLGKTYDANYPKMILDSDGVLSVPDASRLPLDFTLPNGHIIVDTTGKTTLSSLKGSTVALITDRSIFRRSDGVDAPEVKIADQIKPLLPEHGTVTTINGAAMQQAALEDKPLFAILFILLIVLGDLLWATLILFLITPAVRLGAAIGRTRLFIPKKISYRIAAAVLIPIILFNAIMDTAGYPLYSALGIQDTLLFWFLASAALALWAGYLAKKMYLPKSPNPRPA